MYLVVIDANVWIRYARTKDIAPLIDRFIAYRLLPVVNTYLLSEIFDAVVNNGWMAPDKAIKIVQFIRKISLHTTERAVYALSPDPKDNYLFDLAIQNNAVFIISDDSKLLEMSMQPRHVWPSNWFLKNFPV